MSETEPQIDQCRVQRFINRYAAEPSLEVFLERIERIKRKAINPNGATHQLRLMPHETRNGVQMTLFIGGEYRGARP